MIIDAPPIWIPPQPAIIRPAEHSLLRPGAFRPVSRAERRAIITDLVQSRRLTREEARRAMFFVPVFSRVVSYAGKDAFEIATALGINSGCWMCLDAGDSTSYSSGQTWTDLSGASCNFYRGSSSSSQSSDPTFNGTPGGLSANEYWSFDGGDFFTKTSSNSTAITNLHKASASYTLIAVLMLPGTGSEQCIFATNNNLGTQTGIVWKKANTDLVRSYASNGSSAFAAASTDASLDTGWTVISVNIDAGSGVGFFTRVRAYDPVSSANTFSATYSSPSTGNAGFTAQIFASGNSGNIALSGSRLAIIAGFSPVLTFNKVAEYAGALAQRFRI